MTIQTLTGMVEKWRKQDDANRGVCPVDGPCCHGACAAELSPIVAGLRGLADEWRNGKHPPMRAWEVFMKCADQLERWIGKEREG
jgi:hypothetical protein